MARKYAARSEFDDTYDRAGGGTDAQIRMPGEAAKPTLAPGERDAGGKPVTEPVGVGGGGYGYTAPSVATPTGEAGATAYDLARAQAEAARTPYSGSAAQYEKPEYAGTFDRQLADIYARIAGRGEFKYDLNADPLYRQYKDNYVQQGKAAMRDTMGRAAALTGGYGSSYGQAVGQQAYDAALQKLGDIVPELYDRAYGRYQDEGNRMLQTAGLIGDLRDTEYGRWRDAMSDYNNDRSLAMQQERQDYDRWAAERDYADTQEQRALQQQASNRAYLQTLLALGYTPTAQEVADAGMTPEQYRVIAAQYLPKGGGYG